jgi:pimeloyl-ACP methyl ester carboxylesterase
LGALVASLIWVGITYDAPGDREPSPLPGLHDSIYWLVAVQVVLLVGIVVGMALSRIQRDTEPGYQPTLGGFTAWFVALLGWLLGGGFSAGVGLWTAQTLGTWTYSAELAADAVRARDADLAGDDVIAQVRAVGAAAPLIVPPAYVWAAVAALIVLGCAIVAVIRLALKVFGKGALAAIDAIAEQGDIENNAPGEVATKIVRARRLARLTDDGPGLIASLALVASALVLVAAALLFVVSVPFVDGFVRDKLGNIAVSATVAVVVAFLGLVAGALRNRQTRRAAAILWDVITFWPRANHPLTPPSYGGRTVFDLRLRMRELLESEEPTRVVLVAHSQGTVIAAATLMQTTEPNERYPLLTFGSPLRRLYACNFPAYFGRSALRTITRFPAADGDVPGTPRWINLWALTDPIGGWVFATRPVYIDADEPPTSMLKVLDGVDCRVFDVQQRFPRVGDYDVSRDGVVCGHSGFWDRSEYTKAVDVLQALVTPVSDGTVDATSPPTAQAR